MGIISYAVTLMQKLRIGLTVYAGNVTISDRKRKIEFGETD